MAGPKSNEVLRHTVIDRLAGTGGIRGGDLRIGVEDLKATVCRDIEWLLNTKRPLDMELGGFPEAVNSILNYGIPDFSQYSAASGADCGRLCQLIEQALRVFEPRLESRSIKVDYLQTDELTGLKAQFRIRGILHVDPVREPVSFDTNVAMDSGNIEIKMTD
ncbi:MAG: type VI secretion system baseplate subunit TssE [Gemmatimonadales bacterium]|nr:MAG: type VI secretion system baseplate subunit TssE [Gemmatimonadales bacterium]